MNEAKHYRSTEDANGLYREYLVYPLGEKYIFECQEWVRLPDGSGRGSRIAYQSCSSENQAIEEYKKYIHAWES